MQRWWKQFEKQRARQVNLAVIAAYKIVLQGSLALDRPHKQFSEWDSTRKSKQNVPISGSSSLENFSLLEGTSLALQSSYEFRE